MKSVIKIVALGLSLVVSACAGESTGGTPEDLGSDEAASSGGSSGGTSSTWPFPVPTGCVSISSTQCRTNVGHYDVSEAERSLDANMATAGYTKGYSPVCRSNIGYTKGTTKVCYRVGILTDSSFQTIGSQWNGFRG